MKKLTFLILFLAGIAVNIVARTTTVDTIKATPGKAGGVYYAYPVTSSLNTPPPKGYQPFYISHYGRHGSRYLISDNDYSGLLGQLNEAARHGALSDKGLKLLSQLDTIWEEARGRGGELSPLGVRQHKAIAGRMYDAFPDVFKNNPEITAKSTTVMRCAHSMFSFIEALKEKNPSLEIPRESGTRAMDYLNYHSPKSGQYSGHDGEWYLDWRKFKNEKTRPDRMINEIFTDSTYVRRHINPVEFMWEMYWVAVDLQNMETDIELWDYFTPEELFNLWEVFNFDFYACNTSYPLADGQHTDNAANLVRNIIETADEYINSGKNGATLRFGHDGNIIPLTALLQLEDCVAYESNPYKLHEVWADYSISPMASNLQLVFFKNKQGNVLVKFMLNEREIAIPIESDIYPFYDWKDAREWLVKVAETPSREFIPASSIK